MHILLLHPNNHSGGAEIAGNWPPAWVAYLTGYLKAGGYTDVSFVDAMTHHLDEDQVRARIAELRPDVVGCTAITPAIYKAERLLQIAREVTPDCVTVLGGIHGTFMYPQVLKEAPWIDAVVRGEGEQVFLNLMQAVDDGIVTEAQFIVGLENETAETLEETYRMARDWKPDMANWAMYTPWPFSDLFQELGDKVEVFDFEKYNFVTPIMKPDAMDRGELLDRVMNNYRRFFMNKTFFQYPWTKDRQRRKYLMGCLKVFMKSGFECTFYDLGRVGYWGPQTKKTVNFSFDQNRRIEADTAQVLTKVDDGWVTMHGPTIEMRRRKGEQNFEIAKAAQAAMACGGGAEQLSDEPAARV